MIRSSAHVDTFARDRLPLPEQMPELRFEELRYPDQLNAAQELLDRRIEAGGGGGALHRS